LVNKVLPFFVTLPTPFLIIFFLTRQVIDEFSKDLEFGGDKFRDLKKRKHHFGFQN